MKIEKEIRPNLLDTSTWYTEKDVICDICDGSCKGCYYEEDFGNFDYAELNATWGFGPPWDGDIWNSHMCVKCIKKHIMPLMRINFKSYMYPGEYGYYKDGEMHATYGNDKQEEIL